jgi:uncharacterized membrane protein YdbT with pleckstrin-like domain
MGYVEKNLTSGEVVVYRARRHRIIFLPAALLALVSLVFVYLFLTNKTLELLAWVAGFLGLATAIAYLSALIQYSTSEFAVTNKQLIVKEGFVRRRSLELLLPKVEGVGVDQDLLGRILDYGTIVVTGTGGTKEPFAKIARPLEFRRQVNEQITKG